MTEEAQNPTTMPLMDANGNQIGTTQIPTKDYLTIIEELQEKNKTLTGKASPEEVEQMKGFLEKLEDLDSMNEDELRDIVRNVVCPDANSDNYSSDMKQLLGRLNNLEAKIEHETVPVYDMVFVSFLNSMQQISYNNMKVFSQILLEEITGKTLSVHEMAETLLKITNTLLENKTK